MGETHDRTPMPITVCNYRSTQAANLSGSQFAAVPTQSFVDAGDVVIGGIEYASVTFNSTTNIATISLPASETQAIEYEFIVRTVVGGVTTILDRFRSIVTNATPMDLTNRVAQFVARDRMEQSIQLLADVITAPPYVSRLPVGLNLRGAWDSSTIYKQNDLVSRGGNLYRYFPLTQTSNRDPLVAGNTIQAGENTTTPPGNTKFWELAVAKGDPGGTGAISIGYDHSTFAAQTTDAASRSDVRGAAAFAIANSAPDLSAYAQLAGANFTGSVGVPQPGGTPGNGQITPFQYNEGRYARLASPAFTGTPTAPTLAGGTNNAGLATTAFVRGELNGFVPGRLGSPIAWVRRSASQSIIVGSANTINWDDFPIAGQFGTSGDWTCPATGVYMFKLMPITFQANNNQSAMTDRMRLKCFLEVNGTDVGDLFLDDQSSTLSTFQRRYNADRIENIVAGQVARIRLTPSSTGATTISNAAISAGAANNVLAIWRIN